MHFRSGFLEIRQSRIDILFNSIVFLLVIDVLYRFVVIISERIISGEVDASRVKSLFWQGFILAVVTIFLKQVAFEN